MSRTSDDVLERQEQQSSENVTEQQEQQLSDKETLIASQLIQPSTWKLSPFGYTLFERFYNPWPFPLPSVFRYLLYLAGPRHCCRPAVPSQRELDSQLPVREPEFARRPSCCSVTWLGHAGCLVSFPGDVHVLCDPVFSQRASPVSWVGPVRRRQTPCSVDKLPSLTAVCISHNHFDHMDRVTLRMIASRQRGVHFYVPKGDGAWMVANCGVEPSHVHELNWWQSGKPVDELEVIFTPASHWSGRNLWDKNRSLWGSFVLRSGTAKKYTVFFAGDTGYHEEVFKKIGYTYGPMNLAAIPIGAYEPRDIFYAQHVSPTEAVKIHQDVRSVKSVGIHWGTFCLSTTEGLLQPREDLRNAVAAAGLEPGSFVTVCPGKAIFT